MEAEYDTVIEAGLKQLIEHGPQGIATMFARTFEIAMRIERERSLGEHRYERTPGRRGFANEYKSKPIDTPAGTLNVAVFKMTGHDSELPSPQSLKRGRCSVRGVMLPAAEMYVKGVSTHQAEAIRRESGIQACRPRRSAALRRYSTTDWRRSEPAHSAKSAA